MKKPELLAPAGNMEKLKTALHYGADAVYMGLSQFSLRARADNFSAEGLEEAARLVRQAGKKFYITLNIFPHNRDISPLKEHCAFLRRISPDAIVLSDPGVFEVLSETVPDIPVHVSTQANITSYRSAQFWERLGAKRLVLARELSIREVSEIRERVSLEIECFVHGALCISYSGRCYISSFLANRSANRGECTNSCRWRYALSEQKRNGEYFPVYEDDRGTYILSSRDLCMIQHLDLLADAGADSFKIEGRMKGINYVAGVVKTYREAIDSLGKRPYRVREEWLRELAELSSRGYTTGMFMDQQQKSSYNHDEENMYRMSHELVGVVRSLINGRAVVALRNTLRVGDTLEFLSGGLERRTCEVEEMYSGNGTSVDIARNEETVIIPVHEGVQVNDLIRRAL